MKITRLTQNARDALDESHAPVLTSMKMLAAKDGILNAASDEPGITADKNTNADHYAF